MYETLKKDFGLQLNGKLSSLNLSELEKSLQKYGKLQPKLNNPNPNSKDHKFIVSKAFSHVFNADCSIVIYDLPKFVKAFNLSNKWFELHPSLLKNISFCFPVMSRRFHFSGQPSDPYFSLDFEEREPVLLASVPSYKLRNTFLQNEENTRSDALRELISFLNELENEIKNANFHEMLSIIFDYLMDEQRILFNLFEQIQQNNKTQDVV